MAKRIRYKFEIVHIGLLYLLTESNSDVYYLCMHHDHSLIIERNTYQIECMPAALKSKNFAREANWKFDIFAAYIVYCAWN